MLARVIHLHKEKVGPPMMSQITVHGASNMADREYWI